MGPDGTRDAPRTSDCGDRNPVSTLRSPGSGGAGPASRVLLIATALAILVGSAIRFDGPTRGYWDTYIAVPAMFMTGQPVDLHRMDGSPRYQYTLKGRIPDDTYDPSPGGFGIASQDQRIGAAILFGAPFAVFNKAAFRWLYAAAWAFTFLFAFLAIARLVGGFAIPFVAAAFLVLNPFLLYLERLNGNPRSRQSPGVGHRGSVGYEAVGLDRLSDRLSGTLLNTG